MLQTICQLKAKIIYADKKQKHTALPPLLMLLSAGHSDSEG